jgi:hypothetical protein
MISTRAQQRLFMLCSALVLMAVLSFALLYRPAASGSAAPPSLTSTHPLVFTGPDAPKRLRTHVSDPSSLEPDTTVKGLRARHQQILRERPVFQHLPFRDHEIGVDIFDVSAQGKLILRVTYLNSLRAAKRHLSALMARYHDPGSEYEVRYQPVFR